MEELGTLNNKKFEDIELRICTSVNYIKWIRLVAFFLIVKDVLMNIVDNLTIFVVPRS